MIHIIVTLAKKYTSSLIKKSVITEQEKAIYEYSFQILLNSLLNYTFIFILSIILGKVVETILFMITFVNFRELSGGYHARTHFKCFLMSMGIYIAFLATLFFVNELYYIYLIVIAIVISIVVIFTLAPVADVNKPLTLLERNRLAKKSKLTLLAYVTAIIVYILIFKNYYYMLNICISMLWVSLSLVVAYLKNKYKKI